MTADPTLPGRTDVRLSRALFLPRAVLVTLELATTLLTIGAVFGFGRGVLLVTLVAMVPTGLILAAQSALEHRRHVWPTEALAEKVASGTSTAADRWALGEALVRLPRRLVYVRFMAWAATLALLVVAVSALGDVGWLELAALGGVCGANALVFLQWRSTWLRKSCADALLPLLPESDKARYLGRILTGRLFTAALLPVVGGALVAFLYDWLFLELPPSRIRELAAMLPALLLLVAGVVAVWLRRATRPVSAHLVSRKSKGPGDEAFFREGDETDPGPAVALHLATALPLRASVLTGVAWSLSGVFLAFRHVASGAPFAEALLVAGGMTSSALATALVQYVWSRRIVYPAREAAARAMPTIPMTELGPRVRVRRRFVTAVLAITTVAGTFAYGTLYLQWRALRASAAEVEARGVLEALWPRIEPLAEEATGGRIAGLRSLQGAETLLLLEAGRFVWSSRPLTLPDEVRSELEAGALAAALNGSQQTLVLKPFPDGAVGVVRPWVELGGAYGLFGLTLLFAAIALVATGVAALAASDFTQPISELRKFARQLGTGDLETPLPVPEPDEVGELALTLDRMRRDLQAQVAKVTELNLGLERKVAERTSELQRALDDLKTAQAQAIHAEKMATVGLLSAGVAHEVNNPLNFIANALGPLESTVADVRAVLEAGAGGDPTKLAKERKARDLDTSLAEFDDLLRLIRNGVRRTQDIVRGLRDFSRRDENEPARVEDVNRLLDETATLLRHEFGDRVTLVRDYAPDARAKVFPGSLVQVFTNLVANAVQAIEGPGSVTLRTRAEGERLVVEVADTGRGIPPEVLPRIFEPFFTTKETGRGTGLGLSIAHGIVTRHGGALKVASTPGVGTTFTLDLPRS